MATRYVYRRPPDVRPRRFSVSPLFDVIVPGVFPDELFIERLSAADTAQLYRLPVPRPRRVPADLAALLAEVVATTTGVSSGPAAGQGDALRGAGQGTSIRGGGRGAATRGAGLGRATRGAGRGNSTPGVGRGS